METIEKRKRTEGLKKRGRQRKSGAERQMGKVQTMEEKKGNLAGTEE